MNPLFYLIDSEPPYYCVLLPEENYFNVHFAGEDWHTYLGTWSHFEPIGKKVSVNSVPDFVFTYLHNKPRNLPLTQPTLF